ncbi:fra a 1-associated protein-like [Rutidosis leptorrhynchoides]|uniref:fra a 1-associated protein-like n=1 Tax=Rutidosis leptorrhynchoides TaxID=125765 RepID=UPI003A9A429A
MGWITDEESGDDKGIVDFSFSRPSHGDDAQIKGGCDAGDQCSTRSVVRSQCKTEEVEPGKFIRKCEKTQELLRDCIGKPVEVLQSTKEYTEEDVSNQVAEGSPFPIGKSQDGPFYFPGLRNDIEAIDRDIRGEFESIEQEIFGGINHFFGAADKMVNSFFDLFGPPSVDNRDPPSQPSLRRGVPIEDRPHAQKPARRDGGDIDLAGLAKDV